MMKRKIATVTSRSSYSNSLQLLQSMEQSVDCRRRFLAVLLLDIAKAFDSLEYQVILEILIRRKYPEDWIEVFRQILPGNRTRIMGRLIYLERGIAHRGVHCRRIYAIWL
jgi:hypothetical protein